MSNNTTLTPNNGAVFTISKIVKAVMSSAAEAEMVAMFINYKESIPARQALEEMGHKQPPTPMQSDNSTAHGVVTNNIESQWICSSTGSDAEEQKENSSTIGEQEQPTSGIMSLSTMQKSITEQSGPYI